MQLTSRGGRRVSASSDKLRESEGEEGDKLRRQMPKAPQDLESFEEVVGGEGRVIKLSSSLPEIIWLCYIIWQTVSLILIPTFVQLVPD